MMEHNRIIKMFPSYFRFQLQSRDKKYIVYTVVDFWATFWFVLVIPRILSYPGSLYRVFCSAHLTTTLVGLKNIVCYAGNFVLSGTSLYRCYNVAGSICGEWSVLYLHSITICFVFLYSKPGES